MEPIPTREKNFLNVDLDLNFAIDIEPLVRELGDQVMTLNRTESFASFELANALPGPGWTDEAIAGYAGLVRGLSPWARAVWDECARRTMNVGAVGHRRSGPSSSRSLAIHARRARSRPRVHGLPSKAVRSYDFASRIFCSLLSRQNVSKNVSPPS